MSASVMFMPLASLGLSLAVVTARIIRSRQGARRLAQSIESPIEARRLTAA